MRGLPRHDTVSNQPLRVMHCDLAIALFNERDTKHRCYKKNTKAQSSDHGHAVVFERFNNFSNSAWEVCNDACKNDQRCSIADSLFRDLLSKPHHKTRAGCKKQRRQNSERHARIKDRSTSNCIWRALKSGCCKITLKHSNENGKSSCNSINFLPSYSTFFLQLFKRRNDYSHQLNDDAGRDVRHDAESKNRKLIQSPTRKHV